MHSKNVLIDSSLFPVSTILHLLELKTGTQMVSIWGIKKCACCLLADVVHMVSITKEVMWIIWHDLWTGNYHLSKSWKLFGKLKNSYFGVCKCKESCLHDFPSLMLVLMTSTKHTITSLYSVLLPWWLLIPCMNKVSTWECFIMWIQCNISLVRECHHKYFMRMNYKGHASWRAQTCISILIDTERTLLQQGYSLGSNKPHSQLLVCFPDVPLTSCSLSILFCSGFFCDFSVWFKLVMSWWGSRVHSVPEVSLWAFSTIL